MEERTFQFCSVEQPVGKDGYVIKKLRKTYHADSPDDEIFTITVSLKCTSMILSYTANSYHLFKHGKNRIEQ